MSANKNILQTGFHPPQSNIPNNLNEEEMLLFAAWIHGMSTNDVAHRYALFSFIQSHITNKAEEPLQRTIEKSSYWRKIGSGKYALRHEGYNHSIKRFGTIPQKTEWQIKYKFTRKYKDKEFTVLVDPNLEKLQAIVNDKVMMGANICDMLDKMNATFNIKSNSRNTRLLNWILQDNDYKWRRGDTFGTIVTDDYKQMQKLLEEKLLEGFELSLKDDGDVESLRDACTITSKRIHNMLTNKLRTRLTAYILLEGCNNNAMFDVLVKGYDDNGNDLLIEVKSSIEIAHIRMAVGQVFDYWFRSKGETVPHLAILLPQIPDDDVKKLLEWLGIGVLWFNGDQLQTCTARLKNLIG